jgi:hypothetical protein
MPAQVGSAEWHDHDVPGSALYLLVAPWADVLFARLERLHLPHLRHRARERIFDEAVGT